MPQNALQWIVADERVSAWGRRSNNAKALSGGDLAITRP
jgi:hypothetical protein